MTRHGPPARALPLLLAPLLIPLVRLALRLARPTRPGVRRAR